MESFYLWMEMLFISLSGLIALVRTSSKVFDNSRECRHPCLVNDLGEKARSDSSLCVSCGFLFIVLRNFITFIVFMVKGCWVLSNAFPTSFELIMW